MNPKPKKSEKERFIGDAILLGHHATASLARIASRIPHPIFCCAMGSGLAVLVYYWRSIVGPLLAMTSALLNHQLPSKDALVVFALCVGSIVFVVVQSRDAMDEYYEREIQKMLEGGI